MQPDNEEPQEDQQMEPQPLIGENKEQRSGEAMATDIKGQSQTGEPDIQSFMYVSLLMYNSASRDILLEHQRNCEEQGKFVGIC